MLTEVNLKDHLVRANFIDNERTMIEVLYTSHDYKQTHSTVIEYDQNHPDCKALLEVMSVDDLHETTYNTKKAERAEFEKTAIEIAKNSGLVLGHDKIDTTFFPIMTKAIFEEPENEDHLFALKLALFEIKEIRDTKHEELKTNLRKSTTKIEALMFALQIIGQERN